MISLMAAQAAGTFDSVYQTPPIAITGGSPDPRTEEIGRQSDDLLPQMARLFQDYLRRDDPQIEVAHDGARLLEVTMGGLYAEPEVKVVLPSGQEIPEQDWKESGWFLSRRGFEGAHYLRQRDGALSQRPAQPRIISHSRQPEIYTMIESGQAPLNGTVEILEAGEFPRLSVCPHTFNGERSGTQIEIRFRNGAVWTIGSLSDLLDLSAEKNITDFRQLFDTITSLLAVEYDPNQLRFDTGLEYIANYYNPTAELKISLQNPAPESGFRFELRTSLRDGSLLAYNDRANIILYGFFKELCGLTFRFDGNPLAGGRFLVAETALSTELKEALAIGFAISINQNGYRSSEEMADWVRELEAEQDNLMRQAREVPLF